MKTFIINLDSEPGRWAEAAAHYSAYGCEPHRWSATTPDGIEPAEWNGAFNPHDKERRIAIVRTYHALMEHLDDTHEQEWLIVQDDVRLLRDPHRPPGSEIHIYGGYTFHRYDTDLEGVRRLVPGSEYTVNPFSSGHVCPKAFRLYRDAIPDLLDAWTDETRQTCESWTPYLSKANCSVDIRPTVIT